MVAPVASSGASTRGAERLRDGEPLGRDRLELARRGLTPSWPAWARRKQPSMHILPFEVEPNAANHLAWMNAILSLQRTLMAAERTAVALIAFGFTMAQLFQNLRPEVPPQLRDLAPHLPRDVGLLMIAAGVGSLALFTWQYLRAVAYLGTEPFEAISVRPRASMHHLACFTAYAVMLLGTVAFASVFVSL